MERKKGFFKQTSDYIEYFYRIILNRPMNFHWVDDEGIPVGSPQKVLHLAPHPAISGDMMEHEARGVVTELVLLGGLEVNAIEVIGSEMVGSEQAITTIQPRLVSY